MVVVHASKFLLSFPDIMTSNSASESDSVFRNGKIRPGIYKIQNVVGKTYVDIREHTKELCGRPAAALEGKGLVRSCPHLSHTVVTSITSSGRFSLLGPDIPYVGCSVDMHLASIAVY